MATAEKVAREHVVLHAFGDGATWTDLDEAGWGSVITKEGDGDTRSEVRSTRGRVAGKQTNDSAETTAILGSLLNTHPEDDMVIYCDNQGCVDVWDRITKEMDGTQVVSLGTNNRALWNRILGMAKARKERGHGNGGESSKGTRGPSRVRRRSHVDRPGRGGMGIGDH